MSLKLSTIVAIGKFENVTSPISSVTLYTAGANDELLQVNICAEPPAGLGLTLTYQNDTGTIVDSPSNDFPAHTIKVKAGTSVVLNTTSSVSHTLYVVLTSITEL